MGGATPALTGAHPRDRWASARRHHHGRPANPPPATPHLSYVASSAPSGHWRIGPWTPVVHLTHQHCNCRAPSHSAARAPHTHKRKRLHAHPHLLEPRRGARGRGRRVFIASDCNRRAGASGRARGLVGALRVGRRGLLNLQTCLALWWHSLIIALGRGDCAHE